MTSLVIRIILLICIFFTQSVYANQQDYPFKMSSQKIDGKQYVFAQNKGPAPVLLHLVLTTEDAIVEPSAVIDKVIKPWEVISVANIKSKVPNQRYRVASTFKFSIGDPDAMPAPDKTYLLPFPTGQVIFVGQAPGGKISTHTGPDSAYAIDFDVPIGTQVLAARKGIVVDIEQGYTEGGNDPQLKANHVLILHEDGTMGLYSHLSADSHVVRFGQVVDTGTLIGYSGNTGYSSGPHLHFSVLTHTPTPDGAAKYLSHKLKFVNNSPPQIIKIFQGQKLLANHAEALHR